MAAGCQHFPGNLAVRQTATTSLKSRFVSQMADRRCRLLLSAALALSLRLIIVPTWERGTLSYVACAWWHALGFGGWRGKGGVVVWGLKLWCAAGRRDDLYNEWLHAPATESFTRKCAHTQRSFQILSLTLMCSHKTRSVILKLQSPCYVWIGSEWNGQTLACWAVFSEEGPSVLLFSFCSSAASVRGAY